MDLKVTTTQLDASLALDAYNAYKRGEFKEATTKLLNILDIEPKNWIARLLLAVCYSKTDQTFAAQRALRFVYDSCDDQELKAKACLALQSMTAVIEQKSKNTPAEFGRFNEHPAMGVANTPVSIDRIFNFV